ncbi:MAG: DegT/DnrJ/EryC1/StrS family aminotransferase [Patescibacteria group bacterium]
MKNNIRVPYAQSVHGAEEIRAVEEVLRGNTAFSGKGVLFEKEIAVLFSKKFGIMVNSGSSANLLAMELLRLPEGSEVITPLLTFATTVAPLVQKKLIPVFVDVDEGAYVVNIDQVERAVTKKTRALMIPSLIGNLPDFIRLRAIAKKHKLILIEDSCDTLGARFAGKSTGAYSDISTTSFYGSHIMNAAGGGGLIAVQSKEWAQRLLVLRGWGRMSSLFGESKGSEDLKKRFRTKIDSIDYDAKFVFSEIGYNMVPLELQAAFGLEQLKKFPRFKKERIRNFERLLNFFKQYEQWFIMPEQDVRADTAWLAFPLTIRKDAPFSRKAICTWLEERNIQTRPVFTGNILRQPGFRSIKHRTAIRSYPVTDHVMGYAFLIGCHQGLSSEQLDHVEESIREFLKKYDNRR